MPALKYKVFTPLDFFPPKSIETNKMWHFVQMKIGKKLISVRQICECSECVSSDCIIKTCLWKGHSLHEHKKQHFQQIRGNIISIEK